MNMRTNTLVALGGAAVAGIVAGLAGSGKLRRAAVCTTATAMRVSDAVAAEAQSIVDDANDAMAEARREARIEAAVRERLAALEEEVRAEVTAEVDACTCGQSACSCHAE